MTMSSPILKRPKAEKDDNEVVDNTNSMPNQEEEEENNREEQEMALVALIEHRTREVQHLKQRIAYYKTQLVEAEKKLEHSQSQLARLRGRSDAVPSKTALENETKSMKLVSRSTSPIQVDQVNGGSSRNQPQSRTELVVPAVNPKISQPIKSAGSSAKSSIGSSAQSSPSTQTNSLANELEHSQSQSARLHGQSDAMPSKTALENETKSLKVESRSISPVQVNGGASRNQPQSRTELVIPAANLKISQHIKSAGSVGAKSSFGSRPHSGPSTNTNSLDKVKVEKSYRSPPDVEVVEIQDRGTKRKLEQKEHAELIPLVCSRSSPCTVHCYASNHISSQHKRKLRSLALCPVNDQLFVTSSLDGMVNLWQLQSKGSGASLLSTTDCVSPNHRRWPEDIAWHPLGNSLFSTYSADVGDSQISVLNLNKTQGRARVTFLEDKPHVKGIINSIMFMPWDNFCFVTGGSDHAVVLWNERDAENSWKPKTLHRNLHSSAVMGVSGMQQKQIVLSAGADKRIIGFDVQVGRADFKHQIDSKCMSVLPNPCDLNLFMVQTGTPEKQLRLFDIRLRQTEIHSFGFKQESSDSQSALINQAWSPDGLYLTSGSVDPVIHIFDIRYNSRKPSQSVRAHQKRVFKAVWHYSLPLLISISSDLHVGLHKIM